MKEFGWTNPMQVPKIDKIVVNIGVGRESADNPKVVDNAVDQLTQIVGQKPVVTKAKKVDRRLQAARMSADRRQGHPARQAHV